ncbi:MAG TPA: phosphatidate cytidylyltransferase [Xanthobacteraceae bacterium]
MSAAVAERAIAAHGKRIVSAVILGLLALGVAILGGPLFLLFWVAASGGILWEWNALVGAAPRNAALALGGAGLTGAAVSFGFDAPGVALIWVIAGAVAAAIFARPLIWAASGVLYAAALLVPVIILRGDARLGLLAVLFLFATVWATDVAALYAGRYFGGPKLAPKISPAKTWSGALGGTVAGIAGGIALLAVMRFEFGAVHFLVAFAVSVVAQLGDLFESWVKRQFSVKDAGGLIPGHGGIMDRLDGFIAAALAAASFGILRAGVAAPAQGLMQW